MANQLFAPIIESRFTIEQSSQSTDERYITVQLPAGVGYEDDIWDGFSVLIKTISTNKEVIQYDTTKQGSNYDPITKKCKIKVPFEVLSQLSLSQYYKFQVALQYKNSTGAFSDVGICKYLHPIDVYIEDLKEQELVRGQTQFVGHYSCFDSTEKVYKYKFDFFNSDKKTIVKSSGWLLHDHNSDKDTTSSTDVWFYPKNIKVGERFYVQYSIITINGHEESSPLYGLINSEINLTVNFMFEPFSYCNQEEGYNIVGLKKKNNITSDFVSGTYILYRSSDEDNWDTWQQVFDFELKQWYTGNELIVFKDYTIQQGMNYRYAIAQKNTYGLISDKIIAQGGDIKADFEDMFLSDGDRQLKIKFNPKVTNFKKTVLEQKIDTLGGEYPFFFRNGYPKYREFPISGLISMLMDENNEFKMDLLEKNAAARSRTPALSGIIPDAPTQLTADNIQKEREFKMAVLDWLTNGEPKLFRSPTEGNFIVRLMNTSLSPNDTLGRMLHTFSSTAYEVMEYNYDNLKELGMFKTAISHYDSYVIVEEYDLTDKISGCLNEIQPDGTEKAVEVSDKKLLERRGWLKFYNPADNDKGPYPMENEIPYWALIFPSTCLPLSISIYGEKGAECKAIPSSGPPGHTFKIGYTGELHLNNNNLTRPLQRIQWTINERDKIKKIRVILPKKDKIEPFNFISKITVPSNEAIKQYGGFGLSSGLNGDGELMFATDANTGKVKPHPTALSNMSSRFDDFSYLRLQIKETIPIYRSIKNNKWSWYYEQACLTELTESTIRPWYSKVIFQCFDSSTGAPLGAEHNYYAFYQRAGELILPTSEPTLIGCQINLKEDYCYKINGINFDLSERPIKLKEENERYFGDRIFYKFPYATQGYIEYYNLTGITSLKLGKGVLMDYIGPYVITEWKGLPGWEALYTKFTNEEISWEKYETECRALYNKALEEVKSILW